MLFLRASCIGGLVALAVIVSLVLFVEFTVIENNRRYPVYDEVYYENGVEVVRKRSGQKLSVEIIAKRHSLEEISHYPDIDVRGEWQRKQVEKFCQKYGESELKFTFPSQNGTEKPARYKILRHLLFDDQRRLLFCFIPKVGCTNVRRFLFLSMGVISEKALNYTLTNRTHRKKLEGLFLQPGIDKASFLNESLSEEDKLYKIRNYFKFTFVRNPLERLLSAFLDKIAPPLTFKLEHLTNAEIYQRYILQRHRKKELNRWKASNGSFELRVRFGEYVEWVLSLDPNRINEHFAPIIVNAQPCRIRYDFYGSFKMYSSDMALVIKKLNANPAYFSSEGVHETGHETKDYMRSYYSQLSKDLKEEIARSFEKELDFYYHLYPEERDSHVALLETYNTTVEFL